MNKFTSIFVILFVLGAVFACDSDYDPVNTAFGTKCTAQHHSTFPAPGSRSTALTPNDIPAAELAVHEERMRYILDIARSKNRKFVSSIYHSNGTLMCIGFNDLGKPNLISHGEIMAITNCTNLYGLAAYDGYDLYTTGEPCAMCAGAIMWSHFRTVVWGTYNHDLVCKICMSNIPFESTALFDTYETVKINKIRVIGGVLQQESDAWFGTYCDRPTNIFYIAPKCNCVNVNKTQTLSVNQTRTSSWIDGGNTQYSQWSGVITNIGTTTVTFPNFLSLPSGVAPQSIWGLSRTSVDDQWALAWNPSIAPGATFNFGYIISGNDKLNFYQE
ncbi:hypothetical protein DLAC_08229 [Tieghemostelium lacteum]|uniref:CMP/dCMP-type deaminase domain-containing protein n=1 Tax=Tieghemostelium lacteum TaxID=361077 RepID=A0A151ZBG7_TIELA|nr:hypothetical protein DLAC_08229 [Tieghemostelium lacteum]|eukprot:KYQ91290.1 hypothetical protein DLAC_08229 [Tieghemostelium lacteum]